MEMHSSLCSSSIVAFSLMIGLSASSDAEAHCTWAHPGHCVSEGVQLAKPPSVQIIEKVVIEKKPVDQAAKEVVNQARDQANATIDTLNKVDQLQIDTVRQLLGDDAANAMSFGKMPDAIGRAATTNIVNKSADVLTGKKTIGQVVEEGISLPLAVALQQAYDYMKSRAKPVPDDVKLLLAVIFEPDLLNSVRYADGDFEGNIASIINTLQTTIGDAAGNNHAVTVNDIIVFDTVPSVIDIKFWAHEVAHVEQYRRLGGIDGFAAEYLANSTVLEKEAEDRANQLLTQLMMIQGIKDRQAALKSK